MKPIAVVSILVGLILILVIGFGVGASAIGTPTTTRTKNILVGMVIASEGYLDEYGELPSNIDESFFNILAGENIEGKNPKEIRFFNKYDHLESNQDYWRRPMRVLRNDRLLLFWSAGADGEFENLVYEGDDMMSTVNLPSKIDQ